MALSAFRRVDLAVSGQLVGWRDLRLLKSDIFETNGQSVLSFGACSVIAVQVRFCANVGKAMSYKAGFAIVAK